MVCVLPEPHQPWGIEQAIKMPVAYLKLPHDRALRSLMIEPRAAIPSMVTIDPVM
jgi:hypothetical protein